jgi:hypothetical protein
VARAGGQLDKARTVGDADLREARSGAQAARQLNRVRCIGEGFPDQTTKICGEPSMMLRPCPPSGTTCGAIHRCQSWGGS